MEAAPLPNFPISTPGQSYSLDTPEQSYNPKIPSPQGQVQTNYPQIQAFPFKYKIQNNTEKRKKESNMIKSKFPGKIPIVCEKDPKSSLPNIDNNRFLIPNDFTVIQFNSMIRKRINAPYNAGLFLLANGKDLLNNDSSLSEVYNRYKDLEDGLLYIAYTNQIPPSKYPQGKMPIKSPQGQVSANYSQGKVPSKSYQNKFNSSNVSGQSFLFKFKAENINAEIRRKECEKIRRQFPEKIPIICERDPKSRIKDIDKSKYLVPGDLTMSNFSFMIRKRLQLPYESALFLFVNGRNAITGDVPLSDVYEWYKDPEDGFLYIAYAT